MELTWELFVSIEEFGTPPLDQIVRHLRTGQRVPG